ncbi:helix-turn-helix domain-containing protein [Pseudonocardia sp. ICBG1293]|uniref:winged helix-turn-helix transcriptional regulator n=1 Tax=Pseudonocardia sp. ICBG1293 TaxID=2844382 RepID=UPI001CCC2427|nr:helix-turn-helix domain-containing protein [Pseudonocardia sp. ICBG1293]
MSTQVERHAGLFSGDAFDSSCPSRSVLDHVTSKWAVLVLVVLSREDHRFSELRRAVGGISEKMLAQTLRTLEGDGFVHREVAPTTPPQVSYGLTGLGRGVTGHLAGLVGWIEDRIPEVLAARER